MGAINQIDQDKTLPSHFMAKYFQVNKADLAFLPQQALCFIAL